jgi:nucleotide-binding universal stress UspA family protein
MKSATHAPRFVVLAGIDGSAPSARVLASAARLTSSTAGGELHLVYGYEALGARERATIAGVVVEVDAAQRRMLEDAVDEARRAGAGHVRLHVVEKDATRAILDTAAELRADIVLVGTHGRKGLGRLILGSVAEAVVRRARCPVLVVRETDYTTPSAQEIEAPEIEPQSQGGGGAHVCSDLPASRPVRPGAPFVRP